MSVPLADHYDDIRLARDRIREEEARAKRKCKGGCGVGLGGMHREGCRFSGGVWESEVE